MSKSAMSRPPLTRRRALASYAALLAASPLRAQTLAGEPPGRVAPVEELVNAFEFEAMAQRKLDSGAFAEIAGSDRKPFDRITFRPRLMVNTTKLDLTADLFGLKMFAPVLIGPLSEQKRFHPDGELAMARGASAAKAVMVIATRSSCAFDQIAAQLKGNFWYQVYPEPDASAVRERAQQAITSGCKAVCLTLGVPDQPPVVWDWSAIDRFRQGLKVPLILKGIMRADEARTAIQNGVQGILISNYAGRSVNGLASPMETLPAIADAVGGKAPILIDGGFRRGSDVLKALAFGARAVLVGRPTLWGLAAYGAVGVQSVMELMQTELARDMAMCGAANLQSINRSVVKIHRW
jgi:4-hydroxymandelate oxidase